MPSSVGRPRKIKNESKIKNETDSSTASESDNDEIEILSVSDAVITLSDEDSQNSSMDCSDILDDSGINLTEGGDGTEAVQENQEGSGVAGEKAKETETADAEFVRSLIESAFWFAVSGTKERGREGPNKDKEAATDTAEASNNDDEVVCVSDKGASSANPKNVSGAQDSTSNVQDDDDDVQFIISDELDARRGSADSGVELGVTEGPVAMVQSIIEEILNNVVPGNSSASGDQGRGGGSRQDDETVVPVFPVESVGETIGIDEDDIVALDIADEGEGGIEVLSEVSHNEIWSLPEIIMLDD